MTSDLKTAKQITNCIALTRKKKKYINANELMIKKT